MRLITYHGFLWKKKVLISGRLVFGSLRKPKSTDSIFRNVIDMIRRYLAIGAAGRDIEVTFNDETRIVTTDTRGNFKVIFEPGKLKGNVSYKASYRDEVRKNTVFLSDKKKIAIVTDVDDTFLVTHSVSFFRRIWVSLSKNYHMRNTVEDIIDIYRNFSLPIFYVSNSQWRLYDVLDGFRKINDMPSGPFLLRGKSKYERISSILDSYPYDLVLIGDDSQKDPEVYFRLKKNYGKRIRAVCIRHISDEKRLREAKKMLPGKDSIVSSKGEKFMELVKKTLSKEL